MGKGFVKIIVFNMSRQRIESIDPAQGVILLINMG
jgi:hypothetical protein